MLFTWECDGEDLVAYKEQNMAEIKLKFPNSIPLDQLDIPFLQGMLDRMAVGFYNYGNMRRNENKSNSLKNIEIRLKKYKATHNTEFLMDAANFCMMEFVKSSFEDAYFKTTNKAESPGSVVNGKLCKGKEDYHK
jgi:hypothetical protein